MRHLSWMFVIGMVVVFSACGGGDDDGSGNSPFDQGGSDPQSTAEDDGNSESGSGDGKLPAELADFPLPDNFVIPFPASMAGGTLLLLVTSTDSASDVVKLIDEGLEAAGYVIGDTHEVTEQQGAWSFMKDGKPGTVTVFPNVGDTTSININLTTGN